MNITELKAIFYEFDNLKICSIIFSLNIFVNIIRIFNRNRIFFYSQNRLVRGVKKLLLIWIKAKRGDWIVYLSPYPISFAKLFFLFSLCQLRMSNYKKCVFIVHGPIILYYKKKEKSLLN